MSDNHAGPASSRLPLSTLLSVSLPTLPIAALGVALYVYVPPYFASHLRVPLAVIGFVWMSVRLIDIPFDVGLAVAMDRTNTRFGRYRLWILAGMPFLAYGLYRLFLAPVGFSGQYLFLWLLVFYLGQSMVTISQSAWSATLATHYNERSRLFSIQSAIGVFATMAALLVISWRGVPTTGLLVISLVPITVVLTAWLTPERIAPESHQQFGIRDYVSALANPDILRLFLSQVCFTLGPGWMSAIYVFYFHDARHFSVPQATALLAVYVIVGLPGALLTGWIAQRIGKHRTLMLAAATYSIALASIYPLPRGNLWATIPVFVVCGMAASGFGLTILAMLGDVADDIRLNAGKQLISLVYAVNGLASKIALAFSIGITFPLLARLGYDPREGHVNTPSAIHNLELSYLIGPIVFVMLGAACVIGWRIDAKRHAEIREQLEARDAALIAEAAWPEPVLDGATASGPAE